MNLNLKDRVVLVTGGSRGIGRAVAHGFGEEGARVALTYQTRRDSAEAVVRDIQAYGCEAMSIKLDLASSDTITMAVESVLGRWGHIDVLINNAAWLPANSRERFESVPVAEWRDPLRANIEGIYTTIQRVVPSMRVRGWGRIVNVSAIAAVDGFAGASGYVAAKAAMHGLTRTLCKELGPAGILINTVMPGLTLTDRASGMPEAYREDRARLSPVRRLMSPDDVARAIVFLGSGGNTAITGEIIRTSGGSHVIDRTVTV